MTIGNHIEEFAGYPVKDFRPDVGLVSGDMPPRMFQFSEGTSNKFWAVQLEGPKLTVVFGKVGSTGQTQVKDFPDEDKARKACEKLIAEKVGKGYVEVKSPAAAPPAGKKKTAGGDWPAVIYRLRLDYDDDAAGKRFPDLLDAYLDQPGAELSPGLVIGAWAFQGNSSAEVVEALVAARKRLPHLKAIFFGDITVEENEISWIEQSDMGPLLAAYPELEDFRVRGANQLSFGKLHHKNLRSLAIESGGLPVQVVREVMAAKLPQLEHLELWLGSVDYGGDTTVKDLQPILSGKLFPKLNYFGLRDCEIADEVAAAVATAPVLERLRVLDLSLGNLSDEGAEALLNSPSVGKLELLDIHYHYVSPGMVKKLKALGIGVDDSGRQDPDKYGGEEQRYISVSE